MMGVKPATDPSVKSKTEAQMIAATTNGKGKMPAFKGKLTDAQIKDSVDYFRTFGEVNGRTERVRAGTTSVDCSKQPMASGDTDWPRSRFFTS